MGKGLDGGDLGLHALDGHARLEHLLVEVEEFDLEVAVGVRAAEQGVALLSLVLGERECRVPLEVDLPLDEKGLACRALAFLASVHEHDALPEGSLQDGLVLGHLDLEPDRLKPHYVPLGHPFTRVSLDNRRR